MINVYRVLGWIAICLVSVSAHAQTLRVVMPDTSAPYGSPFMLPVYVGNTTGKKVVAVEMGLAYSAQIFSVQGAESRGSKVALGWSVEDNILVGSGGIDTLLLAMSTAQDTLSGSGVLVHLLLETQDIRHPAQTPLGLMRVLFNDGTPVAVFQSGSLKLTGNTGRLITQPDSIFPRQALTVFVDDLDEDRHSARKDTVRVHAVNRNNGDGQDAILVETELASGVFRGRLATQRDTAGITPFDGVLGVAPGDEIRVTYLDSLNAVGATDTVRTEVHVRQGTAVDVNRFVLLATHSMALGDRSEVHSGFVGVRDFGNGPFLSGGVELDIEERVVADDSVMVFSPRVRVGSRAEINGTLIYTDLISVGSQAEIGLSFPVGADYWPLIGLPEFKVSSPGTRDVVVQSNRTETLVAGAYDELEVRSNGTLIFSGGVYHVSDVVMRANSDIRFSAPSEVRIVRRIFMSSNAKIKPASGVRASDIRVYVAGINGNNGALNADPKAVEVGNNAIVHANLYAPNGMIKWQNNSEGVGSFIGRDVFLDYQVQMRLQSSWPIVSEFVSPLPPWPQPSPVAILGDFNGDGLVNLIDFLILVQSFGHTSNPIFDLNHDGQINFQDLLVFLLLYKQANT